MRPKKNRMGAANAVCVVLLSLLSGPRTAAQSLTISQVDAGRLLTHQSVDLYLTLTDTEGRVIPDAEQRYVTVQESTDGHSFHPVPVLSFGEARHQDRGVTFFLLVDNSGSMYDTLGGRPTTRAADRRITHVREALRTFLNEIRHPDDRVALASFNTFYTVHSFPTRKKGTIYPLFEEIERPEGQAAFTELYAAMEAAAVDAASAFGRRVLIVLSDGEDYPYYERTGEPHPAHGTERTTHEDVIDTCRRIGVTVFAINFGHERDSQLWDIAYGTGGRTYDATSRTELEGVYRSVREQVLAEYLLTYRATVAPTERKHVRVRYETPTVAAEGEQVYYSGTVFGAPVSRYGPIYAVPLAAGLLLWWLTSLLRFRNRRSDANLEVIGARTKVFPLTKATTVIGPAEGADLTIARAGERGNTGGSGEATLLYDEKAGTYTVVAPREIRVNNQPTRRRPLEPGDVLNLDGTIVVFDDSSKESL